MHYVEPESLRDIDVGKERRNASSNSESVDVMANAGAEATLRSVAGRTGKVKSENKEWQLEPGPAS